MKFIPRLTFIGIYLASFYSAAVNATDTEIDVGEPFRMSEKYRVGDEFMHCRLLGTVKLKPKKINGLKPRELSGLVWDDDEQILMAVSDDGYLVHLVPTLSNGKLIDLKLRNLFLLRDQNGQPLEEKIADAEGAVGHNMRNGIAGDSTISVSFEQSPRIVEYSISGEFVRRREIPAPLDNSNNYAGENQELEALTDHPRFGMITAPERPLPLSGTSKFTLYGLDGSTWTYDALDPKHSALVGMDTTPNGDILVLERRFASMFQPVIFAIRELKLSDAAEATAVVSREIAHFDTSDGWAVDNFEAIAHHQGNRYFVISDDNESVFQKTLLLYLEILPLGDQDQSVVSTTANR